MILLAVSPLNSKLLCYYKLPITDSVCASRCTNWEAYGNVDFITSKQTVFSDFYKFRSYYLIFGYQGYKSRDASLLNLEL